MQNGDTLAIDDLISRQYENLPYPEISPMEISNEKKHYEENTETPYSIAPAHTLEKHNHYLHRGNENFQ